MPSLGLLIPKELVQALADSHAGSVSTTATSLCLDPRWQAARRFAGCQGVYLGGVEAARVVEAAVGVRQLALGRLLLVHCVAHVHRAGACAHSAPDELRQMVDVTPSINASMT